MTCRKPAAWYLYSHTRVSNREGQPASAYPLEIRTSLHGPGCWTTANRPPRQRAARRAGLASPWAFHRRWATSVAHSLQF